MHTEDAQLHPIIFDFYKKTFSNTTKGPQGAAGTMGRPADLSGSGIVPIFLTKSTDYHT